MDRLARGARAAMRVPVWGRGFRVQVQGLRFRALVEGAGRRAQGAGLRRAANVRSTAVADTRATSIPPTTFRQQRPTNSDRWSKGS